MDKLYFGTGGFPHTTKGKRSVITAMERIKELGLDAMELEFTHSVWMKPEVAQDVNNHRKKLGLELSVHGPYYVNLAAETRPKQHASMSYVIKAAKLGALAGAHSVTFHPASYLKRLPEEVYQIVKKNLKDMLKEMKKKKININLSPELTGKKLQFGDLNELIRLAKELNGLNFCIDFSHKHARSDGKFNSYDEFSEIFEDILNNLGEKYLKDMHIHVSGIEYTQRGESNHVNLLPTKKAYLNTGLKIDGFEKLKSFDHRYVKGGADLKWQELLKAMRKFQVAGILTCESPNLEQDALLMKRYYESL